MEQQVLSESNFSLPGQTDFYRGKVRDVYSVGDRLVIVATDRISAFDVVLPRAIPHKGQVLNQMATQFLEATRHIVPNWIESVPHPYVAVGRKCAPFKVEMVIRGYLTGHAWREYRSGKRQLCGATMPDGLREHDPFPQPIITPTTKAQEGHDEDISPEEILRQGLMSEAHYRQLESYTRQLYDFGSQYARQQGLILVDTKYEFGLYEGQIHLIDEIHTPDSSRYFHAEGYEARQAAGQPQEQLSKEFVREWLMANGFQGKEGQAIPQMTDQFVEQVSKRYIALYETMTGQQFSPANTAHTQILEAILRQL